MDNLLSNPIFLVIIAFVVLVVGILSGLLLGSLFRDDKKSAEEIKSPSKNLVKVAHIWRDRRDGRVIFQVEDQYYKRGSDLTPKERKILLKVVMDFYQWLEPPSPIKPEPVESVALTPDALAIAATPPETTGPKPPGFRPVQTLSQALETETSSASIPQKSIVAQIDDILQEKINAAKMQRWAIRLVEFPGRGMVVMVGLEQYEGIDAVPYERVRVMIREAVAEWERRAGG